MPSTALLKLPYPAATDPVAQGAAAIQALAAALETDLQALNFSICPTAGLGRSDGSGIKTTGQYGYIPWAPLKASGLRWQFRLVGEIWDSQNIPVQMQMNAYFGRPGQAISTPSVLIWTSGDYATPHTNILRDSGWQAFEPASTYDAYEVMKVSIRTGSNGAGDVINSYLNLIGRIVAA